MQIRRLAEHTQQLFRWFDAYRTENYPEQKDFFEELQASLGVRMKAWVAQETFGADADMLQRFEQVKRVRSMSGLQARMPFTLAVY